MEKSKKDEDKRGYQTELEAREELIKIVEGNYNSVPKRNRKPSRIYFSEITKLWHLTSSPNLKIY